MQDIDFDEIDRAVNSVSPDKANTAEKPEETMTQPDVSETSQPVSSAPKPSPALAGRRSSGQFMDVVHPSSNMRRAPITMPQRPVIQNPAPPTPEVAETPPIATELPTPTIPNDGWSDSKGENEDADIDKINDDLTKELDRKSEELPDTPFISGTKVEKRPLGAFSTEPPTADDSDVVNESQPDSEKTDSLPDELQENILSIESKESTPGPEPQPETVQSVEKPEIVEKTAVPATESQPAVATSINQQYKEKPSTGDRDSGPIYDTNSYHKPLLSPSKKKSSWKIIIWILGILIVGVGAGVVAYYFI
jgi:hypothetical protein